jgi:DNA-binding transcriptional ArsR family regulator
MSALGLLPPCSEELTALRARTVGREALLRRLCASADERKAGGRPLPLYLFGPPGVGKTHLVALARAELLARGLRVRFVPDDLPAIRSAEELMAVAEGPNPIEVLIVEGLDRRLAELGGGPEGHSQRQKLRGAWSSQALWVIGTGAALSAELVERQEPFYGWFDPEPVEPLQEEEARALLERGMATQQRAHPRWPAQQEAWLACASGSPRTLTALVEAVAASSRALSASEGMAAVVERFAGQSRAAFRALSPTGQHIAWQLAFSPRAATPGELALQLQTSPQSLATQARRLASGGVLSRTEDGRSTWYSLADPLLRYWLEASACCWAHTRVALVLELIEASGMSPQHNDPLQTPVSPSPSELERTIALLRGEHSARAHTLAQQLEQDHLHPELTRLRAALLVELLGG